MNTQNLLPHNLDAYVKVMEHYNKGFQRAAIVQATGTGKSYVGGAVCNNFKKPIVIAPNKYVLNQAVSATKADIMTATYSWLSRNTEMPQGIDLIWLDEFHRAGAETWSDGVERLIQANPNAKILGTTATPIRYLEQRDMSDILFEGDVVKSTSLSDAWIQHILRTPIYVIGMTNFANMQKDYREKISNSRRMSNTEKREAMAKVDNLARRWDLSFGVPSIISKYIDSDIKKIIVFAPTIQQVKSIKQSLIQWFNEAGRVVSGIYYIYTRNENNDEQMELFERNDDNDGIKLLISVDMLNEGIHVKNVDAVILLRSTISQNLYMQQIGRCFSVGQKHQPVILDLADSLSSACGYDDIYNARARYYENVEVEESDCDCYEEFSITDTLVDVRQLMSEINNIAVKIADTYTDVNEQFDKIEKWCELNGRYPRGVRKKVKNVESTRMEESRFYSFLYRYRTHDRAKSLKEKYFDFSTASKDERLDVIEDFCNKKRRLPKTCHGHIGMLNEEQKIENNYGNALASYRKKGDNRAIAIYERFKSKDIRFLSEEERIHTLTDLCTRLGHFPHGKNGKVAKDHREEIRWAAWARNNADVPWVRSLMNKYCYSLISERQQELRLKAITYCNEHQCLPPSNNGKELYNLYDYIIKNKSNDDELLAIYEKYRKRIYVSGDDNADFSFLEQWCNRYGILPNDSQRNDNRYEDSVRAINIYKTLRAKQFPKIKELFDKYNRSYALRFDDDGNNTRYVRLQGLRNFVTTYGYLPTHTDEHDGEKVLANYWSRFRDEVPEAQKIFSEYPNKRYYLANLNRQKLFDVIRTTGDRPHTSGEYNPLCDLYNKLLKNKDKELIDLIKDLGL